MVDLLDQGDNSDVAPSSWLGTRDRRRHKVVVVFVRIGSGLLGPEGKRALSFCLAGEICSRLLCVMIAVDGRNFFFAPLTGMAGARIFLAVPRTTYPVAAVRAGKVVVLVVAVMS